MSDCYSLIVDADGLITSAIQSNIVAPGGVKVDADTFMRARSLVGKATYKDGAIVERAVVAQVPNSATLSDWRVGLTLWGRIDDVTAKVAAVMASKDPKQAMTGRIASERLQYANAVLRGELLALKDIFGFTAADVDESMWRAAQVAAGDLTGVWPLTNGTSQ